MGVGRLLSVLVSFAVVVGVAAGGRYELPRPGWRDATGATEQAWRRSVRNDVRPGRTLPSPLSLPPALLPPPPLALAPLAPVDLLDRPHVLVSPASSWTPSRCPRGPPSFALS
jgi:hypothetical protein